MKTVLLCILLTAVVANAELTWKQTEVKLQVHPVQVSTEAVFEFKNTGDKPVSISNVIITCGCLSSKPVKESYAPGESGQVTVVFDLRGRTGKQNKYVMVETDDGNLVDLALSTEIPPAYTIEPTLLVWEEGDTEQQKTVRLINSNKQPIRLLSVTSSHKDLPAELKTIREGFEYQVLVTRAPEAQEARSVLRIATAPPKGLKESQTLRVYVFAE